MLMIRSILLCFVALVFVACFSEAQNISPANSSNAEKTFASSTSDSFINNKSLEVTPTPTEEFIPPLRVILPTKKELNTKGGKAAVLKAYLTGAWEKVTLPRICRNIYIGFPSSDYLCVEDNHIYIEAFYKLNAKQQKVYVYFKKTKALSDAALTTPWNDIDKNKPIAVIDVSKALKDGLIEVKWLGFVNKKTGEKYDYGTDTHNGTHRKQIGD